MRARRPLNRRQPQRPSSFLMIKTKRTADIAIPVPVPVTAARSPVHRMTIRTRQRVSKDLALILGVDHSPHPRTTTPEPKWIPLPSRSRRRPAGMRAAMEGAPMEGAPMEATLDIPRLVLTDRNTARRCPCQCKRRALRTALPLVCPWPSANLMVRANRMESQWHNLWVSANEAPPSRFHTHNPSIPRCSTRNPTKANTWCLEWLLPNHIPLL